MHASRASRRAEDVTIATILIVCALPTLTLLAIPVVIVLHALGII